MGTFGGVIYKIAATGVYSHKFDVESVLALASAVIDGTQGPLDSHLQGVKMIAAIRLRLGTQRQIGALSVRWPVQVFYPTGDITENL